MSDKKRDAAKVATIHHHMHIMRKDDTDHEGEVTIEEQIAGVQRFLKWHHRQVLVGEALLRSLITQKSMKDSSELRPGA